MPRLKGEVNVQIRGQLWGNPWVPHLTKEVNIQIRQL